MNTDTDRQWISQLPAVIRERGVSLQGIGIDETAWPIDIAAEVIDVLRQGSWAVLGGDLFRQAGASLSHTYDNWHCDIVSGEPWAAYAQRSCESASRYLAGISTSPSRWFTVVAVAKPDAQQLAKSYDA